MICVKANLVDIRKKSKEDSNVCLDRPVAIYTEVDEAVTHNFSLSMCEVCRLSS